MKRVIALHLCFWRVGDASRRQDIRHVKACHADPVVCHPERPHLQGSEERKIGFIRNPVSLIGAALAATSLATISE